MKCCKVFILDNISTLVHQFLYKENNTWSFISAVKACSPVQTVPVLQDFKFITINNILRQFIIKLEIHLSVKFTQFWLFQEMARTSILKKNLLKLYPSCDTFTWTWINTTVNMKHFIFQLQVTLVLYKEHWLCVYYNCCIQIWQDPWSPRWS